MNKKYIYLKNIAAFEYPKHVLITIKKDDSENTLKIKYKATKNELLKIYWLNNNRTMFNRAARERKLYKRILPFKKPNSIPPEYLRKSQKLYRLHI